MIPRLLDRFGTSAGTGVLVPVTPGATATSVTFRRAEPTPVFGVMVQPSWLTTVAITSRTRTGFALSFGTAAPAGATVDWCLFRSED